MDIKLWEQGVPYYNGDFQVGKNEVAPSLTPYLLSGKGRACVIVFPGGGYRNRAEHEAEPVALWLNSLGFSAFVLNYRIAPYKYPAPMADAQRAIKHIRHNSDNYGVNPNQIAVLGFSAGGHLACVMSALYTNEFYKPSDDSDKVSARPDAAVLCYPVVSLISHVHAGSVKELLGDHSLDLRVRLSCEKIVHCNMPPVFLWHTIEDNSVPVEHSIMLFNALRENKVSVDCHIFNNGGHGIGIGQSPKGLVPVTSKWVEQCAQWLKHRLQG